MTSRPKLIGFVVNGLAWGLLSGCEANGTAGGNASTDLPGSTAEATIAIAGPLEGSSVRPLLGVNGGPILNTEFGDVDLTVAYRDIGVNAVRTHDLYGPLDMAMMYPDRMADPDSSESYDFEESDERFAAIRDGGFATYFRLGDSFNNVTPPANAEERANWVRAAVKVIQHYQEELWDGFQGDIEYVEIGNEPNNKQFWPDPFTPSDFHQLYIEAASALRESFPSLRIGGPGLGGSASQSQTGINWTRAFLDAISEAGAPLDFLSWHLYTNDPAAFETAAIFYREELAARELVETELHVTEWNTDTRIVSESDAVALRDGGQGAALLTAMWIIQQDLGIEQSFFYRGGDPELDSAAFFGLLYGDGRPKRMALGFELWSTLETYPTRLVAEITGKETDNLVVLAAMGESGHVAVLVANTGNTSVNVAIKLDSGETLEELYADVSVVSDASEQIESTESNGAVINIDAFSVGLMRLDRR